MCTILSLLSNPSFFKPYYTLYAVLSHLLECVRFLVNATIYKTYHNISTLIKKAICLINRMYYILVCYNVLFVQINFGVLLLPGR